MELPMFGLTFPAAIFDHFTFRTSVGRYFGTFATTIVMRDGCTIRVPQHHGQFGWYRQYAFWFPLRSSERLIVVIIWLQRTKLVVIVVQDGWID
eukprot:scaffold688122_cov51-Attheya_sp.AAC.1